MDEKDVGAGGYQVFQPCDKSCEGSFKAGNAPLPGLLDAVPVQPHLVPVVRLDPFQLIERRTTVIARLHIEPSLQRDVDDFTPEKLFGRCKFLVSQWPERPIGIPPSDSSANNFHSLGAGFLNDAVGVAAAEQLAAQDEHVPLL